MRVFPTGRKTGSASLARGARLLAVACVAGAFALGGAQAHAAPRRVVSMNLCTDQLAMLVAAPGQIASVSWLSQDPHGSAMAAEARKYPANHGQAEEVFAFRPDLVIAGAYTTRTTVRLLRRLGVRVAEFKWVDSLGDIRDRLRRMGAVLGREEAAAAIIAKFDADLAAARVTDDARPRAALYYANSYTSGTGSLADDILKAAGLSNIATGLGYRGTAFLSLEELVMARPDLLVTGRKGEAPALAGEVLTHPALRAMQKSAGQVPVADRNWVCGTPFVIAAIRRLVAARKAVIAAKAGG